VSDRQQQARNVAPVAQHNQLQALLQPQLGGVHYLNAPAHSATFTPANLGLSQ